MPPLREGDELLQYRILDKLGEGGMGVVWRALDTTLERNVAVKVLPEGLGADAERLLRFEREAKLLASISHPNIAEIFGLHVEKGHRFIVMELVEGEDLSQRIQRGALSGGEVLELARQVASALEVAHEQGIVHRDLKPANLMWMPDGRVKILDFGLAKALEGAATLGRPALSGTLTLASPATVPGVILGTAAYMSPEQARGQEVDKRADIWALGCILYEALTGRIAFAAETISDTLAAVLTKDPDLGALPRETDPALRLVLARCLEKDARQRLRDVGEVRVVVESRLGSGASASLGGFLPAASAVPEGEDRGSRRSLGLGLVLAALALSGLSAVLGAWLRPSAPEVEVPVRQFRIELPGLDAADWRAPALSPDGRRMLYVRDGLLVVRSLDQLEERELVEVEKPQHLTWSPDGKDVAWIERRELRRASVSSGDPFSVCDVPFRVVSLTWGADDRLLLAAYEGPIYAVQARGGDPEPILEREAAKDLDFHSMAPLPGDRGLVFVSHREGGLPDTIEVLTSDLRRFEVLRIEGQIVSDLGVTPEGWLVYRRSRGNDGIWAVPLSLESWQPLASPTLVEKEGLVPSISNDGSLLYTLDIRRRALQLAWVDLVDRSLEKLGSPVEGLSWIALSPNGEFVAFACPSENLGWDLWMHDVERGTRTRLTFDEGYHAAPAWSPDGTRLAYVASSPGEGQKILILPLDGSTEPREVALGEMPDWLDDSTILFERRSAEKGDDLYILDVDEGGAPEPLLVTPRGEEHVQASPDGRFYAYSSDASGRDQVYLAELTSTSKKWQVSVDGGTWPRWSASGTELFFHGSRGIMVVSVEGGPEVRLGTPRLVLEDGEEGIQLDTWRSFDIAQDGRILALSDSQGEEPALVFVENWRGLLD